MNMRKILLACTVLFVIGGATVAYKAKLFRFKKFSPAEAKAYLISAEREEEDGMEEAMEQEFRLTRDPKTNVVPTERLLAAKQTKDLRLALMRQTRQASAVTGINWQERGPNNIGGRTRAVIFDLNDAANGYKKVWSGGVGGGLWYCNDITAATPAWNKVNDFFDNIAICSMVQNPLNPMEMYVGTGEGWFNGDAIKGLGIWKSADGGANWTRLASTANFSYVNKLMIDKNGVLYAAVRQSNASDAAGVQRSADGGATWVQVLGSGVFGSDSRGADLECAANGDVYATLGTVTSNGGVYMSDYATNANGTGGLGTWIDITPNTSGVVSAPANFWQRIELACAPSDANIVYALFQGNGSDYCTSIQQYNKATNTWAVKTVPNTNSQGSLVVFTNPQAWYNLIAAVDPNDANVFYVGGLDALRTNDGGSTWTQMTAWTLFNVSGFTSAQNVHADQHAIVYAPGSSSRALWGTDGGVSYTANANISSGKPTFSNKNAGYNVTQYYACALHPSNGNYFLAGAQDNGTHKFSAAGINSVTTPTGGDGAFCHIDQDNPNVQITSYVNNNYYISTDGGGSFASRSFSNGSFINPTDYDKAAKKLYGGNTAGTYLRWEDPSTAGRTGTAVSVSGFNSADITHVSVSPLTANRVYFGLNNGSVVRVDAANTGTSQTGVVIKPIVSGASVSCVAVDPSNENHIIVTYSNYGVAHVSESVNANSASPTWTNVQNNLPDMPVRWAMFDPRTPTAVLLATELGVWSTDNLNGTATDWQPTNSGLANVRVDMLKYRTGDRTIAAATHGRGLFTAIVPNVTTADINFATGVTSLVEQNTGTTGCRRYKDYTVPLTIANAPVGDATVSVSIAATSGATQGIDFDITTNGNFSNPSNTLTFANGSTVNQNITVRIYDDAQINASRSFTLAYSITGGTSTARTGASYQQETIAILDNDVLPSTPYTGTYTVGSSVYYLGSTSAGAPFDAKIQYKRSQMLYTVRELNTAGLSRGTINSIAFAITKSSTRSYQNLQIKMGMTTAAKLFDGTNLANVPTTTVKNAAAFTPATGTSWNTLTLDNPFYWDGTSNLVVETCYDNGSADASNFADRTIGYSDGSASTEGNMIYQDGLACGSSFTAYTYFSNGIKPMMMFNINATGTLASTVLNSSATEYLASNSDLYYYSAPSDLIARITNLSGFNYGCTSATLDRAGNSAKPFWNNNPANYVTEKTFLVTPATNNPSGSYQITLYFTAAEKAGWEAATGNSWNNIKLIKTQSAASNVTPTNPGGAGAVQVVTPVFGTLGTNYTLSYTFSNGFSGFAAGIPGSNPLPVTLLDFTGRLNNATAFLNWSTSTEQNAKSFYVEKSTDGNSYYRIGTVAAAGNSATQKDYSFTDDKLSKLNYYRLRMNDLDGRNALSKVVLLQYNAAGQSVWVVNNPFTSYIDLRLGKDATSMKLQLLTATGNLVEEKTFANTSGFVRWNLGKNVSNGTYVLCAVVDGASFSSKLMKQ